MATDDFFRARLEQMIDLRHPLSVLTQRMPWSQIEAALAPAFARGERAGQPREDVDLFGATTQTVGAGISAAGRPRLTIRLMSALLYLKHAFNLSDEELVERWAENVVWQYFSGQEYYEPRLPCDATQVGRFRGAIGEAGVEELLKATIDTAVATKAVRPNEFERVIVDTTVQEKAIAHPVDSRLLEIARAKVVQAAKFAGIALKQTLAREGKELRRKAGGYAHAKQFKRLKRVVKRQRTILGIVLREIKRKLATASTESPTTLNRLNTLLERAERIRTQQPKDKNKLYALHAPEVECIGKGKARKRLMSLA
jgi:IS5 family transposase